MIATNYGDNTYTVIAAVVVALGAGLPVWINTRRSRRVEEHAVKAAQTAAETQKALGKPNGNGDVMHMQSKILGIATEIVGWTQHHDTRDDERFAAQEQRADEHDERLTAMEDRHEELRTGQTEILANVETLSDNVEAFMAESRADRDEIHAGGAEMVRYGNAQLAALWAAIEGLGGQRPPGE